MGKQISGNCVSTYYTCKKREQNRIGKKKERGRGSSTACSVGWWLMAGAGLF
jgi:hypothetical protein